MRQACSLKRPADRSLKPEARRLEPIVTSLKADS
jgi:hypothetical protein